MSKRGRGNSRRRASGTRGGHAASLGRTASLQVPPEATLDLDIAHADTRTLKRRRTTENLAESAADIDAEIIPGVTDNSFVMDSTDDDDEVAEDAQAISPLGVDKRLTGAIDDALDSMEALEMPANKSIKITCMVVVPKGIHGSTAPITRPVIIFSDTPYEQFCSQVAAAFDPSDWVTFSDFEVSYKTNWATRNSYTSLATEAAYTQMLHVLVNEHDHRIEKGIPVAPTPEAMATAMAKLAAGKSTSDEPQGKGKGRARVPATPKPFSVTLTDNRSAMAIKASCKAAVERLNLKTDEPGAEGLVEPDGSNVRFLLAARKRWSCPKKDPVAVCVGSKSDGKGCVHLSPRDIGEWRMLVENGTQNPATNKVHSLDDIPLVYVQRYQVILWDQGNSVGQANPNFLAPQRRPSVMIDSAAASHVSTTWSIPSSSYPPSATHSDPGYGTGASSIPFSFQSRTHANNRIDVDLLLQQNNLIPSIDVPFPLISEWLKNRVDGTLRGAGHKFSAYGPILEQNGYLRVDGLANSQLDADTLAKLLNTPRGFIESMLLWAQEDVIHYKCELLRKRRILT